MGTLRAGEVISEEISAVPGEERDGAGDEAGGGNGSDSVVDSGKGLNQLGDKAKGTLEILWDKVGSRNRGSGRSRVAGFSEAALHLPPAVAAGFDVFEAAGGSHRHRLTEDQRERKENGNHLFHNVTIA